MANTNQLARATAPFGFLAPRLLGPHWLKEFDRFFNREFPLTREGEAFESWVPALEVFEKDGRLTVRLDAPGLTKENVAVHVAEGVLTVEGERKQETEEEKNHWYRSERTYGRFYRTVPLPEGVIGKEVEATLTNGVLEITARLPSVAATAPHKGEVRDLEKAPATKVTVAA